MDQLLHICPLFRFAALESPSAYFGDDGAGLGHGLGGDLVGAWAELKEPQRLAAGQCLRVDFRNEPAEAHGGVNPLHGNQCLISKRSDETVVGQPMLGNDGLGGRGQTRGLALEFHMVGQPVAKVGKERVKGKQPFVMMQMW